jgi:cytochrome c biogenesis protein CcdA
MGTFIGLEGLIVLYALIVAIPIVLLGALLWWITRGRRQRDERRLLASA